MSEAGQSEWRDATAEMRARVPRLIAEEVEKYGGRLRAVGIDNPGPWIEDQVMKRIEALPGQFSLRELRDSAIKQATSLRALPSGHHSGWLPRWADFGTPIFELTGGLTAALVLTECRGLCGRDLRLPFGTLAVQLPSPSALAFGGRGEGAFMVVDAEAPWLMVLCLAKANTASMLGIKARIPADDEPIEKWAREVEEPHTLRFLANFCAYINSLRSLPPPEGRRSRSTERRNGEPAPPLRWVLGREIRLSRGMVATAKALTQGGAKNRGAYRVHSRFMVRGHWRNQVCGKGRAERRVRWIEPFWKGPEMADALARLYAVAEPAPPAAAPLTSPEG
jgi:hypothetical protein